MSRLSSYRQKQFNQRVVYFGIGLILLLIFISTVGFNFIINSSLFFGGIGKSNKVENSGDTFFGTLEVDTPPVATNSARIVISGLVDGYDTVEISINNRLVKTITDKSNFSEAVGNLRKGDNQIEVLATLKKSREKKKTEIYDVQYIDEKPLLEITEPADGSKTSNNEIKIVGKTNPNVTMIVNDSPTVVDVQGGFQTFVRLKEGENKIMIVVTDIAGNTETKELIVHYQKDG